MDEIRIDNLEVFAHHGVFPQEKEQGQHFYVNAVLYTDLRLAGLRDDLNLSTHYGDVSLFIEKQLTEHTYDLIEAAAETAAQAILLHYPLVRELDFELRKPHAPIPMQFESVSVKIRRGWHQVYIAFGSNLGDRRSYIDEAVRALKDDEHNRVEKISDILETEPYGGVDQGNFLNGVLKMDTLYTPHELLEKLHELEQAAGRERKVHWGPRTLDLDILFYDKLVYEDKNLILPHVDLQNRDFVLRPMVQLAPWFRHPLMNKTMEELLTALEEKERLV